MADELNIPPAQSKARFGRAGFIVVRLRPGPSQQSSARMPTASAHPPASRRQLPASPMFQARASGIHGRGVYATADIPEGTRLIEYVGERITKPEARRRETQRLSRQRRGGDASVYIFELNRRHDLDGRIRRNTARLINHSCLPNCQAETIRGRVWIVAKRDLVAGEELTFDYGFPFKEWLLHPCRCGAPVCVGYIVNQPQRWRVRRILRGVARASRP